MTLSKAQREVLERLATGRKLTYTSLGNGLAVIHPGPDTVNLRVFQRLRKSGLIEGGWIAPWIYEYKISDSGRDALKDGKDGQTS